jgi:hypothetical protein
MTPEALPRRALLSSALYVVITVVMGRDVIAALATAIASDPGDPLLTTAILAWNASHVPWSGGWYQYPIFFPMPDALVLSEHLLSVSLIAAPIQWLTSSPVVAYNVTMLLSYPLSGVAMFALVWRLTRNTPAAFLAGLAYAFAPYRVSHLPHIQVLISYWMPVALLGLHAYLDTRRWPWLALFAAAWMLQGAANGYFLVYFTLVVGLWVVWFLAARGRWRDVAAIAMSMMAAAVPLAPIIYRYITVQRSLGLSRGLGEINDYSGDIAAVLCAPESLTFWGWLRVGCRPEGEFFAGTALIVLCVAGAAWARSSARTVRGATREHRQKRDRVRALVLRGSLAVAFIYGVVTVITLIAGPWQIESPFRISSSSADKPASVTVFFLMVGWLLSRRFHDFIRRGSTEGFYLLCAAVCWVLSWGPFPRLFGETVLYQAPYAWLVPLPGFSALRVPARFWMMVVLCLVVFMGLAIARLIATRTYRTARILVVAAACGLVADGFTTIRAADVPRPLPPAVSGRTVLFLPIGDTHGDIAAGYHAVTQEFRTINGLSGYEPAHYEALRTLAQAQDDRLFGPFVSQGDVYVVVSREQDVWRAMVERQPGARLESALGRALLYRVPRRQVPPLPTRPSGARLPLAAVTSQCSSERLALLTDGDISTGWGCGIRSSNQSVTAEIAAPSDIGAVVQVLGSAAMYFPRQLRVETSMDGDTWTTAWEGSPAAEVLYAALASPRDTRMVIDFPPRPARYVRLLQLGREGDSGWSIAELEVWSGARLR